MTVKAKEGGSKENDEVSGSKPSAVVKGKKYTKVDRDVSFLM